MPDTNTATASTTTAAAAAAADKQSNWNKFVNSTAVKDVKTLSGIGLYLFVTTAVVVTSVKLGSRVGGTAANKASDLIGLDKPALG